MSAKRPNILFILADQHSPLEMGCAGHPVVQTPHLDQLSSEGVVFDNCYCQNPLCVPSRASLLTGQYCRSHGIYDNQHILESNSVTFPRVLSSAGYRTCLIGKAHFNGEQFQGFQQRPYGDLFGQAHQPDPRRDSTMGVTGLGRLLVQPGPSAIPIALTQTEVCVAEAAKWLQAHIGLHVAQPFCLCVHLDKPHFPMNPPRRYFARYERNVILPDVPRDYLERAVPFVREAIAVNGAGEHFGKDRELHERALAAYYGCVEWVDDAVGRLLEVLEYLELAEDTVVIYASDHGEMAARHGFWQKTVFFEPSARVPLIMRWPMGFSGGQRRSEPVGLIDLFPTLSEIAAAATPATCEGLSLLPLLRSGQIARDAIFSESVVLKHPEHAGCMIRTGHWKYSLYLDGYDELYDIVEDPQEWHNLAMDSQYRDAVEELRDRVTRFWHPEEQAHRYSTTPRMAREKHFYEFSNQFLLGDGVVVDARP